MTARRAGWLTAAVVFAGVSAPALAGNATDAGERAFALLRAVPLAAAAGVLTGCVAASSHGRRAAVVAALSSYVVIGVWIVSTVSPRTPEEEPVRYALDLVAAFATGGTALALATATIAWWVARHAVGRDGAERLLALGSQDRWGEAMRAELASIDDPAQRRGFARSAARVGTGRWPALLAALAGAGSALVVFFAARSSDGRGLLGEPLMSLILLLLVAAVLAGTLIGRSFRAGLETALLAWLAVYVCSVAVEIPQALAWYRDDGILLLDGEPAGRVDALGAALQPLTHSGFIVLSVSQLIVAVLAAGLGALALNVVGRGPEYRGRDSVV